MVDQSRSMTAGDTYRFHIEGMVCGGWSQYMEVGIGPDAEVFTKAQPLSSVGFGASVGLHPASQWNHPEPEIVLAVDSHGNVKGATLGNDVNLRDIEGQDDGFRLEGESDMAEISRDPLDLVKQTLGTHHQYPDGVMLYLGTMFSPIQDRDGESQGFTHHLGDIVTISTPALGALVNNVGRSDQLPLWTYGIRELMRDLAGR